MLTFEFEFNNYQEIVNRTVANSNVGGQITINAIESSKYISSLDNIYMPLNALRNANVYHSDDNIDYYLGSEIFSVGFKSKTYKTRIDSIISNPGLDIINRPYYFNAKCANQNIVAYNIGYHSIYLMGPTNAMIPRVEPLITTCVRTEKIHDVITNVSFNPDNFIVLVNTSCLSFHKGLKSIAKKYVDLGIDVLYTHDIMSNFNTYDVRDISRSEEVIDEVITEVLEQQSESFVFPVNANFYESHTLSDYDDNTTNSTENYIF